MGQDWLASATVVLQIAGAVVAIGGNGFLIYLFCTTPRLRKAQCNRLVLLLNICDAIIGVGVLVSIGYTFYTNYYEFTSYNRRTCYLFNASQGFGIVGGQVVLVFIGLDRLMAVVRPMRYGTELPYLAFLAGALALACALTMFLLKPVGTDANQSIALCSTGSSSGELYIMASQVFNVIFLISLCGVYIVALSLFLLRFKQSKSVVNQREFRIEVRLFVSVSAILLSNFIFYGVPLTLNVIASIMDLSPTFRGLVTRGVGHGTLVCAVLNVFIYLCKHHEIRSCAVSFAGKALPGKWNPSRLFISHSSGKPPSTMFENRIHRVT